MTQHSGPTNRSPALRCHLCGGRAALKIRGAKDYLTLETFDVVRCETCGVMQIDPMPGDEVIERYYPARYRVKRHSFTNEARCKLRAWAATRYFPKGFRGRLLDVGCGDGSFALMMKRAGWEVSALEIDTAAVQRLKEQGLDARETIAAMEAGFDRRFDVITCWHVLEHVMDPRRLAEWMRQQLGPRGIVHISVPNIASWQAKTFGKYWLHLDVPRHRYHFSRLTLGALLKDAELRPIDWTTFAIEYDWFGYIQSALNSVCAQPNVLFERLTSGYQSGSRRDRLISMCLGPLIAAATLPECVLSGMCGAGGTLSVACRADVSDQRRKSD